jgi:hypothetical protein
VTEPTSFSANDPGDPAVAASRPAPDPGFLPAAPPRAAVESVAVRLVATAGIIGIGTAIGAIMATVNVAGWVLGLVVSAVSVVLAAVLWRSRRL